MARVHDETSTALLDAAHRLLAADGPEALTVRRIATEAGMSTMNVYSRFGGKDGVLDEIYRVGFERLFAAVDAVPEADDGIADLMAIATSYRGFALEHPEYYAIMFGDFTPSPETVSFALEGLAGLVGRVERDLAKAELHPADDFDPTTTTAWLWATCHGLVSLEVGAIGTEVLDWRHIFDAGIRTSLAGLHRRGDVDVASSA